MVVLSVEVKENRRLLAELTAIGTTVRPLTASTPPVLSLRPRTDGSNSSPSLESLDMVLT